MNRCLAPIGEVVEINSKLPACITNDMDASAAFLPMAGISEEGRVISTEVRKVGEAIKGYTYFAAGDVLMAKITPCMENGKAAVVESLPYPCGFGSTEFHVLRPGPDVYNRYLFHFVWSSKFRRAAEKNMTGTAGQKRVPASYLERTLIPLPSVEEQKRIASILDKADAIRRKRRESLRAIDEFLRSVFLDMFGDPITNPKGWRKSTLGELATVERGRFSPRPRNDPSFYNGRYPFIQTGDIADSGGQIRTWRQTLNERGIGVSRSFPKGAIVMAIVGATIGRTAILNFESYCPDSVVGIQPKPEQATPSYVECALRMRRGELLSRAPETARANLNLEILRPFPIVQPPIELQQRFSNIVVRVNEQRQRHEEALFHADRLFSALQRDAFENRLKSAGSIPVTALKMATPVGGALAEPSPMETRAAVSVASRRSSGEGPEPVAL